MREKQTATHVLVPAKQLTEIYALTTRTRVRLADYLREAVDDLLRRYVDGVRQDPLPVQPQRHELRSLVFRLDPGVMLALKALATKTRVHQSDLLREALEDLLVKYRLPAAVPTEEAA